ncbi:MAG: DUF4838 domain-containing protein [Armatimonadota bacterium]
MPSPLTLVKDGTPLAGIVLADPAPPARFAAEELQRYLREMSGAELPITDRATGPAIVLTTDKDLPNEDAHTLRMEGDRLSLTGGSPRAVLYAAYLLLERLGCGFCIPGIETIPEQRTLTVPPLDLTEVPAFPVRSQVDFPFTEAPLAWNLALIDWLAKNRFNWYHPAPNAFGEPAAWFERKDVLLEALARRGLHLQIGGHTLHTWLPPARYADVHPEWFALLKRGRRWERVPPLVCVSNQEMHREVAANICAFLDRNPEVEAVDCWEADIGEFCQCPGCLDGIPRSADEETRRSAYIVAYIGLINDVARVLAARHPGVKVAATIFCAGGLTAPQRCPEVADNVIITPCHIMRDSYLPLQDSPANLRLLAMDVSWRGKAKHVQIYEYYNAWTNSGIYPIVNVMAEDLQLLRRLGFTRVETDQAGWNPLNLYAAARLLWNPELSWEAIIADFCRRHYGDAAEAMTRYWLDLERGIRGKPGYIADLGGSTQYLLSQKDRALAELRRLIDDTTDSVTRDRLQRELIPWEHFGERPYLRASLPEPFTHHWPPPRGE